MPHTLIIQGLRDDITEEEVAEMMKSDLEILKMTLNKDNQEIHGTQAILDVVADPAVVDQLAERYDGRIVDGRPLRVRSTLY